jgi:hypothetical protein
MKANVVVFPFNWFCNDKLLKAVPPSKIAANALCGQAWRKLLSSRHSNGATV